MYVNLTATFHIVNQVVKRDSYFTNGAQYSYLPSVHALYLFGDVFYLLPYWPIFALLYMLHNDV